MEKASSFQLKWYDFFNEKKDLFLYKNGLLHTNKEFEFKMMALELSLTN